MKIVTSVLFSLIFLAISPLAKQPKPKLSVIEIQQKLSFALVEQHFESKFPPEDWKWSRRQSEALDILKLVPVRDSLAPYFEVIFLKDDLIILGARTSPLSSKVTKELQNQVRLLAKNIRNVRGNVLK